MEEEGEVGPSSNGLLGSDLLVVLLLLVVDFLEMYPVRQRGEALDRRTSDGPRVADIMIVWLHWWL